MRIKYPSNNKSEKKKTRSNQYRQQRKVDLKDKYSSKKIIEQKQVYVTKITIKHKNDRKKIDMRRWQKNENK